MKILNLSRSSYLQAMGITEWRLRQKNQTFIHQYGLFKAEGECVGWLIADSTANSEEEIAAEQNLLLAICKAVGLRAEGERKIEDKKALDALAEPILMVFSERHLGLKSRVNSHSLMNLIKNPALKKETWRDLQVLMA